MLVDIDEITFDVKLSRSLQLKTKKKTQPENGNLVRTLFGWYIVSTKIRSTSGSFPVVPLGQSSFVKKIRIALSFPHTFVYLFRFLTLCITEYMVVIAHRIPACSSRPAALTPTNCKSLKKKLQNRHLVQRLFLLTCKAQSHTRSSGILKVIGPGAYIYHNLEQRVARRVHLGKLFS